MHDFQPKASYSKPQAKSSQFEVFVLAATIVAAPDRGILTSPWGLLYHGQQASQQYVCLYDTYMYIHVCVYSYVCVGIYMYICIKGMRVHSSKPWTSFSLGPSVPMWLLS